MNYTIDPKETTYKGIKFRSRLEARWAAYFDLCGWDWLYEPIELKKYLPDFVLRFERPVLVEVKPALSLDALKEYYKKIENSGWTEEALLVGASFFPDSFPLHDHRRDILGLMLFWEFECDKETLRETNIKKPIWSPGVSAIRLNDKKIVLLHSTCDWIDGSLQDPDNEVEKRWIAAGELVRFTCR